MKNRIEISRLFGIGVEILEHAGTGRDNAGIQVDALLSAELRGHPSHEFLRLLRLAEHIEAGAVHPNGRGSFSRHGNSLLQVGGRRGLEPVVMAKAIRRLQELVSDREIAMAYISNSNHIGMLAIYFGGISMPNRHPVKWLEEYLYYYTRYGTTQALNISPGQLMVGYLLNQLGVDNEFKVSVFYGGSDSAFGVFHTLAMASLMSRPGGRSPLIGLNLNNSANLETIKSIADLRGRLGMTDTVRIEHHVTEAYKSIVPQPYCRRDDLVEAAHTVTNIAAKHEGGDPEVESTCDHSSDIMYYFVPKSDSVSSGLMSAFQRNYMDKHNAMQRTA